ncbi:MAG: hypothetical protein IT158_08880 [Bryobacterales bacterium]|nr:hypothetical protein [Bryobacterales bacterium]
MMRPHLCIAAVLWAACLPAAEKYSGPRPAKSDIPFLLHADNLVETETVEAKEESRKDEITYVVAGAGSTARTPLAGPIFLFQSEKVTPEKLELYRLEVKNGRREITFSKKKKKNDPRPYRLDMAVLDEGLYRIEVYDSLEAGEYSLTPAGSNQVFCFQVY